MSYDVILTKDAESDIEELHDYLSRYISPENADSFLDSIEDVIKSLTELPNRGSYPKELLRLGIRDYREVFFKSYRVIYRVLDQKVFIYLIADRRRDFTTLLEHRLLH
ncbi:type II toxin-antitoxin system RelE/ParE family toxin [Magnetococcales bacterium HHB-1]